jgi:hypothetical protein
MKVAWTFTFVGKCWPAVSEASGQPHPPIHLSSSPALLKALYYKEGEVIKDCLEPILIAPLLCAFLRLPRTSQ